MSIIAWLVLGIVVGLVTARWYRHTSSALGLDVLLGAIGAVGGGLAFSSFGSAAITEFNVFSWLGAAVGAFAILGGFRAIFQRA